MSAPPYSQVICGLQTHKGSIHMDAPSHDWPHGFLNPADHRVVTCMQRLPLCIHTMHTTQRLHEGRG